MVHNVVVLLDPDTSSNRYYVTAVCVGIRVAEGIVKLFPERSQAKILHEISPREPGSEVFLSDFVPVIKV